MTMNITWEIEGEVQLARRLRIITDGIEDFKPAYEKAGKAVKEVFEGEVFESEGRVIGEKWQPLSPVTLAQKAKKGYSSKPLVATGLMKDSFEYEATSDMAVVNNTTEYFKYHQSKKPRTRLPRRVMMKLYFPQRTMIVRIFQKYIKDLIG